MENTALVRLFDILSSAEKRRIKKKLENTERSGVDMLLLFNYLDKHIKKPTKLSKELVYKAVIGKLKKFNENKLTQLRFKLYRFIEDQIVIEQIMGANENKEHLIQKELILLDYFRDKVVSNSQRSVEGIARLVESKMNDVENLIKTTKVKDINYHLNLYRLSHHLYYNLSTEIRGEGKPYLSQLMENLDIFYCLSKLRYSFEIMQRNIEYNDNISILFFEEMYNFSKSIDSNESPLVLIYRLLADLSNVFEEKKIVELKNELLANADNLGKTEMLNSLYLLLNLIMMQNNVDTTIVKYEVNQFILQNKLCILNGEIRPQFLINCAANFLRAGKSEEFEKILEEYKDYIPKNYKEKTTKLCTAYQLFGAGNFKKCSHLIYKKPFLPFNLQAKTLLLKSTYETEFSLKKHSEIKFFDVLDNYKRFVNRRKLKMNQNLHQSTINFANCLLRLTNNTSRRDLEDYINGLDFLAERRWLLEKNKKK